MRKIENLVFKGGGILGIAYAGALNVLEEKGVLKDVQNAAGTSVGALVAALVCFGYSANEIEKIMKETDFNNFLGNANPLDLPKKYGIYSGDFLLNWIQDLVEAKAGDKEITFAQMQKKGFKNLHVVSTNLSKADMQVFSSENTPDTIVSESIRASMSIPIIFTAWKFSNKKPNDHIYVDGGVMSNYPISTFKKMKKTLGFFIETGITEEVLDYDNISKYAKFLFKSIMHGQDLDFLRDPDKKEVTVGINSLGISTVDFDLEESQQQFLFQEGKRATKEYFEKSEKGNSFWSKWL